MRQELLDLDVNKICQGGAVKHITRHDWRHRQVAGNIQDLVTQVAGMRGAQLAIALDVPLLQQIGQALVAVVQPFYRLPRA